MASSSSLDMKKAIKKLFDELSYENITGFKSISFQALSHVEFAILIHITFLLNFLLVDFRNGVGAAKKLSKICKGKDIAGTLKQIKTEKGCGVLHFAAAEGKTEICLYLIEVLEFDIDIRSEQGETPLFQAAKEGRGDTARYLLEHGADPAATNHKGTTPLHCSAEHGHTEVMRLLLSKGVQVDPVDHCGTPLHLAASRGQQAAMRILLENNAGVNNVVHHMLTPLVLSISTGSLGCIKILIEAGADVNLQSPLDMAIGNDAIDLINCLLEAGADPNVPNEFGFLPIELAASAKKIEIVKILFPLTSPIEGMKNWRLKEFLLHVETEAFQEESKRRKENKLADLKVKGKDALERENFSTAIFFYSAAIHIDSGDATLSSNRSLCWQQMGNGAKALMDAQMAQILRPDWPEAYYRIGSAFMLLEEYEQASEAFNVGLRLDPDNNEIKKALEKASEASESTFL